MTSLYLTKNLTPNACAISLIEDSANHASSESVVLSAIRLGMPLPTAIIQILNNTEESYNTSTSTSHLALAAVSPTSGSSMHTDISTLRSSRATLLRVLSEIP
ncbi:hypothetical protein BDQ12DRAFT_728662 [Crucibulum laeve]|uniref:Uncharacterized protein n=1 Tax=Crucibulum laeve TaxID=68775 RepID=A0A5C3LUQ4_9AGAR|nr:hypothetical protein BDQ12DRAFT_728662 [Crucibulum laeve]